MIVAYIRLHFYWHGYRYTQICVYSSSGAPNKFEAKDLEEILDEDLSQTLEELGKTLQVDESTVSKRIKVLGLIQKQGH